MRVISQDGRIDIPYDYFSLSMSCARITSGKVEDRNVCSIVCHNLSSPNGTKLAEYSTEEKAKKAMEELRYAYMCHSLVKMGQTPPDGIDENIDEKLTMGLSGVFQFPAEEELE